MGTKSSRECFLDLLRIFAAFLVIVNHTNSSIFRQSTPDSVRWFFSISYFFLSKVAVPIFFMISGYLLLRKIDPWKKSMKRIFRIVVVLFFCAIIYSLYDNLYVQAIASPVVIIKSILAFYKTTPSNALWYLYAYLGILLMLPFLQRMAHMMSKKDYHIFFVVSGFFSSVLPILNHYNNKIQLNTYFEVPLFAGFICMLFIGQYFGRFGITKTKLRFCIALFVFVSMVILNVALTFFEYQKSTKSYLFYDNIRLLPILLQSVSCFYMFTFAKIGQKASTFITYVGSCTFGIYLISDMSIRYMKPVYANLCNYMHPFFAVILFEVLIFLIGFLITIALKRVPILKNYL